MGVAAAARAAARQPPLPDLLLLLAAALIAIGGATAASCALVVLPVGIRDARASVLRSEGLTVGHEHRQRAGEHKCHKAHCYPPSDIFLSRGSLV